METSFLILDNLIDTPVTEREYLAQGYAEAFVEATAKNQLRSPFAVWRKDSGEGVEVVVVGCATLHAWGDTFDDAVDGLLALIDSYRDTFDKKLDELSPVMREGRDFARRVVPAQEGRKK